MTNIFNKCHQMSNGGNTGGDGNSDNHGADSTGYSIV